MSDPLFSVTGKSILVSGAASGLGRAMALDLAGRGAFVTVVDRAAGALDQVVAEAATTGMIACAADVTDETDVLRAVDTAIARYGALHGVVNCAGILRIAPALDMDLATFRQSLDVNVTGAFVLSRTAARAMAQGGRIVHISSVSSRVANSDYAAYATSKAGLSHLVRVLAREWAGRGLTVNAIGPAMTETAMTGDALADPAFRENALAQIPMRRFGTPRDLIGTLLLLLSEGGSFITGQTIYVDGGRTLV